MTDDTGKPLYFKLEEHIAAIVGMIRSDELQIALRMCDQIPGYYRDHYPPELAEIKRTLYRQMYDQLTYASDPEEGACKRAFGEDQWNTAYCYPRAEILENLLKALWPRSPWIFDLGASHGNCPLGLIKNGKDFRYKGVGLNSQIIAKLKEWVGDKWADKPVGDQPTILFCSEVLEHCFNPQDLVHSAYKEAINWDYILFSTPLYTLGGGLPDWETRKLGHVRCWTPAELFEFCNKNWPGYTWEITREYSMVLCGKKN